MVIILFADGQVDAVTFATGTGGTVAGVAMYLKSKKPQVKAVVADPDVSSKLSLCMITYVDLGLARSGQINTNCRQLHSTYYNSNPQIKLL